LNDFPDPRFSWKGNGREEVRDRTDGGRRRGEVAQRRNEGNAIREGVGGDMERKRRR
jgi:hypothetical protein